MTIKEVAWRNRSKIWFTFIKRPPRAPHTWRLTLFCRFLLLHCTFHFCSVSKRLHFLQVSACDVYCRVSPESIQGAVTRLQEKFRGALKSTVVPLRGNIVTWEGYFFFSPSVSDQLFAPAVYHDSSILKYKGLLTSHSLSVVKSLGSNCVITICNLLIFRSAC